MAEVSASTMPVNIPEPEEAALPVEYGNADSLESIAEIVAARQEPIRVRLYLQLFNPIKRYYAGWRNKHWKFQVANPDEARRALEGIEILFDLIANYGIERAVVEMTKLKRRMLEQRD
jgi:hypothetical protein